MISLITRGTIILLTVIGFVACYCYQYQSHFLNRTAFPVHVNTTTPKGIAVDTGGRSYPLEEIDARVDSMEKCLQVSIDRRCFNVKIMSDFTVSPCTGKRIFPCAVNESACAPKIVGGQKLLDDAPCEFDRTTGTAYKEVEGVRMHCTECPCGCRAKLQDLSFSKPAVVTEPGLEAFPGELARLVLKIHNPWSDRAIAKCVNIPAIPDELISNWLPEGE